MTDLFSPPPPRVRVKCKFMSAAIIPLHRVAADSFGRDNVVLVRLLALCPMLAVSVSVAAAATLGALTLAVMAVSGFCVSLLRSAVPDGVRLPVFLLLVAALVVAADLTMEASAPDMHRRLGIFLPLIITNCAVLARLEVFARRNAPAAALLDGTAAGGGMLAAIVALATAREFLATGGIAPFFSGAPLLPSANLPAGGFMLFGLLIAAARALKLPAA
ncbi:MAG: Rnf-Nqr domain containing protein [Gammaproteobacteria bacterium]